MGQANPDNSIEAWFDEFHVHLLAYLTHRLNMEAEAEDLAQEVFLRLLRLDDPTVVNHPRAFLFRIASNVVNDWRDRHYRVEVRNPDRFDELGSESDPYADTVAGERARALDRALDRLPPSQRAAIVLKTKHGMSHKSIARHIGASERMVKRYLIKGYAGLRQYLAGL